MAAPNGVSGNGRGNGGNGDGSSIFLVCCLLFLAVVCVVAETVLQATGHPPAPWIGTLAGTALGAALLWISPPKRE